MANGHLLPPTYEVSEVKLSAPTDSKITNINLYSNRAEVTRSFKVAIASGQNNVVITQLPNSLDQSSLRVEGRGAATIHDVSITRTVPEKPPTSSPKLDELNEEKEQVTKALERCKSTLASLAEYLKSVNTQNVSVTDLLPIVDNYNAATEKYDKLAGELERKLKQIKAAIDGEKVTITASVAVNRDLLIQATIGVFSESQRTVELILIYAVNGASWGAKYDVRARTDSKESTVELVYKASIYQSTGENWTDVPLTLETAAPTFGHTIPLISSWTLSVYKEPMVLKEKKAAFHSMMARGKKRSVAKKAESSVAEESDDDMGFGLFDDGPDVPAPAPAMAYAATTVTSQGGVNATFKIPGVINIPSDGIAHSVTIASIVPEAKLSWITIPSVDTHVHLTTNIKNTSEYTLLSGESSVYVDGTFISKSRVPLVSPQESFTCGLGLDPSIRVTYHPRVTKATQSGLINKTTSTSFAQRITVQNTKSSPVEGLRITDRVPISQDALINIKVVSPELVLPGKSPVASLRDIKSPPPPIKVSEGVIAQWHGADQPNDTFEWLGKDGKFDWICSLPAQKKIDLALQWEVSAPVQTVVVGL